MATAIVSAPTAQVFTFPKAKKRGRKVTKGPKASAHVIYEWDDTPEPPAPSDNSLESNIERMAVLIANRAKRKDEEWAAILAANPNITEFPKEWRYRTLAEVEEHRRAGKGGSDLEKAMDPLADRIAARAKELMGGDAA